MLLLLPFPTNDHPSQQKICVNNFLLRSYGSYNNELYYEVGFNEVVGSLKMRLHFYFALIELGLLT